MSASISLSDKFFVLLRQALVELLYENDANLADLIEAYDLPAVQIHCFFDAEPESPEEYYRRIITDRTNQQEKNRIARSVLEAVVEDVRSPSPVVFKERWFSAPGHHPEWPPPLVPCLRQLELEGYTIVGGKVRPTDAEAPAEVRDQTRLAATIRTRKELDPQTLVYHIEQSDSTAQNGNWHPAAGEARSLLEGLCINMAVAISKQRNENIPSFPTSGERRAKFGPCRNYLHGVGLADDHENDLLAQIYSYASVAGGHPGITDEETAKLVRRICWVTAHYLTTKYVSLYPQP